MNIIKKSLVLLAMGAAISSSEASLTTGNTMVYITGSTGFRATVNNWFASQTNAAGETFKSHIVAQDGGTVGSPADLAAAKNLLYTNIPVTINGSVNLVDVCFTWIGSEAGIQTTLCPTSSPKKQPFYDLSKISSVTGFTSKVTASAANTTSNVASICFADNTQALSYFPGAAQSQDGVTYLKAGTSSGTGTAKVAVIPFNFYANYQSGITNLPAPAWYDILTTVGGVPLSELTGNTNDATSLSTYVFPVGRNIDSGTRQDMQAVCHIAKSVNFQQVAPTASSRQITGIPLEGAGSINGISMLAGNNGETSGGNVAKFLTNSGSNYGVALIGYVALADAIPQYTNGIVPLTFNGVAGRAANVAQVTNTSSNPAYYDADNSQLIGSIGFTNDIGYTNVITGAYPYWGYECVSYNTNNNATDATNGPASVAIYNSMLSTNGGIRGLGSADTLMFGAIKLEDMKVNRGGLGVDGGAVSPGAFGQ